jgi:hypothetical protein
MRTLLFPSRRRQSSKPMNLVLQIQYHCLVLLEHENVTDCLDHYSSSCPEQGVISNIGMYI